MNNMEISKEEETNNFEEFCDSDTDSTSSFYSDFDNEGEDPKEYLPGTEKILENGWIDIKNECPNMVLKKIIKEGEGERPSRRSKVRVLYTGTLEDGTVFDENQDRNSPFVFRLAIGEVIKGWDIAIGSMKVGEISEFKIASQFAYGKPGQPPRIPPDANLHFKVELLDKESEPWTDEEKIEYATKRKIAGNEYANSGKWKKAYNEYERGLVYVGHLYSRKKAIRPQISSIASALHLNLSLCCLKIDPPEYNRAVIEAVESLKMDDRNPKAYFRIGQGRMGLREFVEAKKAFEDGLKLSPNDLNLKQWLEKSKKAIEAEKEREKKMFGGIFQRMAAEEQSEKKDNKAE
ncbi:putative Peptidylprolyl isomerase D [Monocercomonoides exilis]|uniref:putative Peptidylprolyl isomerase D n=1 Tax=Monocercomonoides exilis TaxID=2049356 RepID=UPI0035595244|nr:putative Peptidylprolyl isomerase D [Monocercomonoides exilis]|eukprot:MONOS_10462.1-p1 / transcript=MONOS_10462.1 / gene=MONOS_10462 / organism=Monocercomonoides_exilis_PA203 / gene_product=Peptidylprolyl isomerase D / transcript_product=Peptidylprolyl isomerase D / location=Mono_scaffold00477:15858-16901(+) / protein_length=347 / sequence_SO=supercontig / SO=protein_coding / is_pseudo=false